MKVKDIDCQLMDVDFFNLDTGQFIAQDLLSLYEDYEVIQISADIDENAGAYVLIDISKTGNEEDAEY